MTIVLSKNLGRAGPVNYVVGIDYPTGAPSPEKQKLFFK